MINPRPLCHQSIDKEKRNAFNPPPPVSVQAQRQGANFSELAQALNCLENMMNSTLEQVKQNKTTPLIGIDLQKEACRKIKESLKNIPSDLEKRYNQLMNQKKILSPKITELNAQRISVKKKPSISERIEEIKQLIKIKSVQASKKRNSHKSPALSAEIVDLKKQLNFLIPRKK